MQQHCRPAPPGGVWAPEEAGAGCDTTGDTTCVGLAIAGAERVPKGGAATAGLNVMIDDEVAVPMVQSVLERFKDDKSIRSRGEIILTALSVPLPGAPQDVSVSIGDGWPVSAQIKGALKSLPGVVLIEDI